jgi:hypothetical protein
MMAATLPGNRRKGGAAMGARPVAVGAAGIGWAVLPEAGGPSGGFFRDQPPLPW